MATMMLKKPYPSTSPEAQALNVLGQKWTLVIIKFLMDNGETRFVEIQRQTGCSTETCRTNLACMVSNGLLRRTRINECPPRVNYELTPMGRAVAPILDALKTWGNDWLGD